MPTPSVRAVLFDLDDTLFDHTGAARSALKVVHTGHECFTAWSFDDLERAHARFLEEAHLDVLAGTKTVDQARLARFTRLFAVAGVDVDAATLEATAMSYRHAYLEDRRPIDGARALLEALTEHVTIGIVSNNIREEQEAKLRFCGLEPYVEALVVSSEVGISKPDPAIFDIALNRLGVSADAAVMVGDSWTADVEGARAAGIRAIWFNRARANRRDPSYGVEQIYSLHPLEPAVTTILSLSARCESA